MSPLDLYLHAIYGTLTKAQVDENWTAIQTLANQIRARIPQNNFSATADPTVTDDASGGYSAGSRWLNTSTGDFFICTDPTTGAAQWQVESTINFSDVTLDAVTAAGNTTANAVDVGELRSTDWVGTVANGSLGHVVERGSNANGEYVKFADGTLICTQLLAIDQFGNSAILSKTWSYPAAFVAAPKGLSLLVNGDSWFSQGLSLNGISGVYSSSVSGSSASMSVTSNNLFTSGDSVNVYVTAIGRWF